MFRIGEFAQIAQVSGRQLRFYDQIGLLQPAHTDTQTGYRYYSIKQLPRLPLQRSLPTLLPEGLCERGSESRHRLLATDPSRRNRPEFLDAGATAAAEGR
jgi:hypothetical protein